MKNILLLFTDQQRFDTIKALGNPVMQTPNLDALANDSVVFERCTTPSPVCVPARLSMLAGQYPAKTGCNNNNLDKVYSCKGFYSMLTEGGYNSCCVGKMHHLWDSYGNIGFKERRTQEEMASPEDDYATFIRGKYPWIYDYNGMRSEMYYVPQISPFPPEDHPTGWIGENSIAFLKKADAAQPFFLMSSFIHPHPPFCPPAPWQKLYRDDPPAPFIPEKEKLDKYWDILGDRCSCKRLEMSTQDVLRMKNFYYACISFVDYQIGRIIGSLKEKGLYDDTLVIFASDHGDMMGDYACTGKRTMVDSSSHVPLLIHYPGEKPQKRWDPCSLVDLAPTLLSYAGIPYDAADFDGLDLFGMQRHDLVFSQHNCGKAGIYMTTDGKDKLVYCRASGKYHFFQTIPEQEDVYSPDNLKAQMMRSRLDGYMAGDVNHATESKTYEKYTKTHPHYPGRMDHTVLHDKEAACIPEGYTIDLV